MGKRKFRDKFIKYLHCSNSMWVCVGQLVAMWAVNECPITSPVLPLPGVQQIFKQLQLFATTQNGRKRMAKAIKQTREIMYKFSNQTVHSRTKTWSWISHDKIHGPIHQMDEHAVTCWYYVITFQMWTRKWIEMWFNLRWIGAHRPKHTFNDTESMLIAHDYCWMLNIFR